MERWDGRVALVTGASCGIGAAICCRLVQANMKVIGVARNVHRIQVLAEELADQPGSLTPMQCDLTKDADILRVFSSIQEQFGGVDVCVNNAGMSHNSSLLDGTPEEWREMMDVNLVALCLCTREAVASMRARNVDDGQIIHISSLAGHQVPPVSLIHFYSATKFAVTAVTEGLRQELREASSNIRVAAVSPGVVKTEFLLRTTKSDELEKKIFSLYSFLQPDDVAASVVHILSAPPHVQIHDIILHPK